MLAPGQYPWVTETDRWGTVSYAGEGVTLTQSVEQVGANRFERFVFSNATDRAVELRDIAIKIPFNDNYPDAKTCVKHRFNTHLWPGGSNGWICATRMGGEPPHVGLVMTAGSFDGYWFGKRQTWGDTFPHYWSCLTAEFFRNWSAVTGDASHIERARAICRGNFSLFTSDGRAGCAYLYPDRIDGKPGKFLDPLANDQDWALVFAGRALKERK